ncbi:MAG: HypC/HybG/HupF family hydrogenase formation chaperone [Nitrososphaerales archaeon]|jgi:hydrogenase maturation factor
MCITRVGKVTAASQGRASVDFFDGRALDDVDVSMVAAARGDFVEVFGNLALSVITPSDAKKRRAAWKEVREAAIVTMPKRDRAR